MKDYSQTIVVNGGKVYELVNKSCCKLEEDGFTPQLVLLTKGDYAWFNMYAKFLYGENADIKVFEEVFGVVIYRVSHIKESVVY
mgnify:CR=1 FL=1